MSFDEFRKSLADDAPPADLSKALHALWYDARADWEAAHNLAQEIHNQDGSWIHAYLHRKEGDQANASYWYSRAGKAFPRLSLDDERDQITRTLLAGT